MTRPNTYSLVGTKKVKHRGNSQQPYSLPGNGRRAMEKETMTRPYDDPTYRRARARYYGQPCVTCGQPSDTIDHIRPIAAGGTNTEANYQPMCRSCNSSRGAATRTRLRRKPERNRKYR